MLTLYDYWRSSAAYRLRIALNLKGVAYSARAIDIKPGVDVQRSNDYSAVNPQMRVPAIGVGDQTAGQSMAILEWLEEAHPEPPLLPADPWARLQVRGFADIIACDIHPLNNLSVLSELRTRFGADDDAVGAWYRGWIQRGFTALEALASAQPAGDFLFGAAPTFAEIALVPQVYNARRFDLDLSPYPRLVEVDAACGALPAFERARPEAQPDAG